MCFGAASKTPLASLIAVGLMGLFTVHCSSPSSNPSINSASSSTNTGDSDSNGKNNQNNNNNQSNSNNNNNSNDNQQTNSAPWDLCENGLTTNQIPSDYAALVSDLCDPQQGTLPSLRDPANIYTGGDTKIVKDTPKDSGTTVSLRIRTSTIVSATPSDYFDLVKLQLNNSTAYSQHYQTDSLVSLSNIQVGQNQTSFEYKRDDGNNGIVDYDATSAFITLRSGKAYVSATKLTQSIELMTALTGLIIINQNSAGKTEVFTISDQTYTPPPNQDQAIQSSAFQAAAAEQQRMYQNAQTANLAKNYLNGGQ
jgi:hypothetical protein